MENQQVPKKNTHGGARANSGGKRPGAGRPKKQPSVFDLSPTLAAQILKPPPPPINPAEPVGDPLCDTTPLDPEADPVEFLTRVMRHPKVDGKLRVDAAKALLPYKHARIGEKGKKEEKNEQAKKSAARFAPSAPPKLAAVK